MGEVDALDVIFVLTKKSCFHYLVVDVTLSDASIYVNTDSLWSN